MSKLITELYKSRNILLDQFKRQGYNTYDFEGCSIQEINSMYDKGQMDMLIEKSESDLESFDNVKVYVKYLCDDTKQITMRYFNNVVGELFENNERSLLSKKDTLMIVSMQELNESLTRRVKEYWEMNGYFVVVINLSRLQYNVLDHEIVPKHVVVRDTTRKEEIKNKYYINNDNQFPTISRFDPVAVAIGLRPGELCEITRPSKTAITTDYFRICVNI